MSGAYSWKRAHRHSYHVTRNDEVIATVAITENVPDHAWHLSNICEVFAQIERANPGKKIRS